MIHRLIAILTLCFFWHTSTGQHYRTTRYADDSGLPSRIVNDVIQDQEGFIWVAGNNGLYKFDGQHFHAYLASLTDTVGLRDNKITVLRETSDKTLWIGTPKGLHYLNQGRIQHFPLMDQPNEEQEYIISLFEDHQNNLWVGTYGGLFMVQDSLSQYISDPEFNTLPDFAIWNISQDEDQHIWVATNEGAYTLAPGQDLQFKHRPIVGRDGLEPESINYFNFNHWYDSIIIVESNKGLLAADILGDTLHLSKFRDTLGQPLPEYFIQSATLDQHRNLWMGTFKSGFKKYQYEGHQLREMPITAQNGFLNMTSRIHSVMVDRQDNIWLANTNGLYKLSTDTERILTFPPRYEDDCLRDFYGIYEIIEDGGGNFWITTPTQLYRITKTDLLAGACPQEVYMHQDPAMQLSRDLFIDSQNRLWVGADNGLFVSQLDHDFQPGPFLRLTTEHGLPHNWCYEVLEAGPDQYWVGNYQGLLFISFINGRLDQPHIKVYTSDEHRNNALVNSQVTDLELDRTGRLWIGTFSGLSQLVDSSGVGTFKNYTSSYGVFERISNNSIKRVMCDRQGRIWIATQRGLNLYLPSSDEFLQLGNDQGLPSEYVLGIEQDFNNQFWIGTTNGVIKANYNQQLRRFDQIEHFTSQTGLADNIPYRNSMLIDSANLVFVGSREGISVILPQPSERSTESVDLALIGLHKISQEGYTDMASRVEHGKLTLRHYENSLRLSYVALDFKNPENHRYRHQLKPVQKQWTETGDRSELSFYNLSPGDYQLILQASDSYGNWSEQPLTLNLTISPPWWQTNWAYICYAIILAGLVWLVYNIRIRRKVIELESQAALERALVKQREGLRKENAADFHDELGSKLAKVSMYLTMAERSIEQKDDPIPWFTKMRNHIKGISGDFRDLLWVIDPQKDTVTDALIRLKDFGEDLFDSSEIRFRTVGLDQPEPKFQLDPQTKKQVLMIFKEAMTNSFKYAACSQVELGVHVDKQDFSLYLKDNGRGFLANKPNKGRGLTNMKNRADKIKATLTINSEDSGTKIHLQGIPHMGDEIDQHYA